MFTKTNKKEMFKRFGNILYEVVLTIFWAVIAVIDATKGRALEAQFALVAVIIFVLFIVGKGIIANLSHEVKHLNAKLDLIARQVGIDSSSNLGDAGVRQAYADLLKNENKEDA